MTDSCYKPKFCAFHPKETILNFCKNPECLLPLCPTCVDQHSEEHRQEKTYGKFENMHQVVSDITFTLETNLKQLDSLAEEIGEQLAAKKIDEHKLRRQVTEARNKVVGLIDRFFVDFEKEVNKSIVEFNVSLGENYRDMEHQISLLKDEIKLKIDNLGNEKVLKTTIGYYSRLEEKKINVQLDSIRQNLNNTGSKKGQLAVDSTSIQKMVNELSQYMHISFENWEQDIKYNADFVKTGFSSRTHSRTGSLANQ